MGAVKTKDLTREVLLRQLTKISKLRKRDPLVILSHGLGVETAAIWKRWVEEPETRPFKSWDRLIVVTAQVGHEHAETVKLMEEHQLPEMKRLGVRFVEVARRGHLEADGIVVLQDTRAPEKLHPEGYYKLGDELKHAGTVPQYSGEHRCALKFKAFVIETWMAYEFRGDESRPVVHVWGYNAGELGRTAKSEKYVRQHNKDREKPAGKGQAPLVVFGFNSEELGRVERSRKYDGPTRTGHYPLIEWGWGRPECLAYLTGHYKVLWIKSACGFCPFNEEAYKVTQIGIDRFRRDPDATVDGLFVEFVSLSLNPKGQLYRDRTMASVVEGDPKLAHVWRAFQARLDAEKWGLYLVQRIFTLDPRQTHVRMLAGKPPKAGVARAVKLLDGNLTRAQAIEALEQCEIESLAHGMPGEVVTREKGLHGIEYVYLHKRRDYYPAVECFYVVCPAVVADKVRGPWETFERRFKSALAAKRPKAKVLPKLVIEADDDIYFR